MKLKCRRRRSDGICCRASRFFALRTRFAKGVLGANVMIGGFIVSGANGSVNLIVRALGPSLAQFGVPTHWIWPDLDDHCALVVPPLWTWGYCSAVYAPRLALHGRARKGDGPFATVCPRAEIPRQIRAKRNKPRAGFSALPGSWVLIFERLFKLWRTSRETLQVPSGRWPEERWSCRHQERLRYSQRRRRLNEDGHPRSAM